MSRFDECRLDVLRHADQLLAAMASKPGTVMNFESLMRTYIEQPGFDVVWRGRLLDLALSRLDGRER